MINRTSPWQQLSAHAKTSQTELNLSSLFEQDPERFHHFSVNAPGIFIDFSKQHLSLAVLQGLLKLTKECNLTSQRDAMMAGEFVNTTENRQALHTALRALNTPNSPYQQEVQTELANMLHFAEQIRHNKNITDIINIGTGGSDLGPRMTIQALVPFVLAEKRFHFVANIDAFEISQVLKNLKPENTLFIVTSKSFTTQETLTNACTAKAWFEAAGGKNFSNHFVAVTANAQKAQSFGIKQIFTFWDWVGGRYSIWSAVGLSLSIAIGKENFDRFLKGAHEMDEHFTSAPFEKNAPVLLSLIDIWNRNFLNRTTRCIAPYHQGLDRFPAYLQQLEMESNGKGTSITGEVLNYATSGVIWGEAGNNGQHAFFQMLHQGTDIVPVDFILIKKPLYPAFAHDKEIKDSLQKQHTDLLMNGLAQSRALMIGKNYNEALRETREIAPHLDASAAEILARHKTFAGNRPSTTMLIEQLTPYTLGTLIALHEHRTFTTGIILGINSFDQWGIELGKSIAKTLLQQFVTKAYTHLDSSTAGLMQLLQNSK